MLEGVFAGACAQCERAAGERDIAADVHGRYVDLEGHAMRDGITQCLLDLGAATQRAAVGLDHQRVLNP